MPTRTDIMAAARAAAGRFGLHNVLVATNSGASLASAREVLGEGYRFFAVGNPSSSQARGLVGHDGISEQTREELGDQGVVVVLQDQSLFQRWGQSFSRVGLEYVRREVSPDGDVNAVSCMYNALQLFGDGPRVCVEIALMAADSEVLPLDEDCLAIACPSSYCGLPDAALVMRPAKSEDMFKGGLRIKELILRPAPDDVWFSDRPLP